MDETKEFIKQFYICQNKETGEFVSMVKFRGESEVGFDNFHPKIVIKCQEPNFDTIKEELSIHDEEEWQELKSKLVWKLVSEKTVWNIKSI